ncbi:MAG: cellulase family glycosylhydrolase [Candidatus Neomarinimicrobiota bacterium]
MNPLHRYLSSIIPLLMVVVCYGHVPFHRGVNLTGWFQRSSVREIQFTQFTEDDFEDLQTLGVDVIRLPINLHFMTNGEPDYVIDPLLYYFLDQVVDWVEAYDMHLILDNHTFDPAEDTQPTVYTILASVWTQLAEHYKDSYENLYYEILNEPHGIDDFVWNSIQESVVQKIREVDTLHTIVVGPAGWNSYWNLDEMPVYKDDNLIYTFHFYDPFLFTHQGASWAEPSLVPLAGVPFPYDAGRMPSLPPLLQGTWIESAFNAYPSEGSVARVQELIDIAVAFREARQVPIFCGEFGVYIPNSDHEDRVFWYDAVVDYLNQNAIAWTMWDYRGGFGLFEEGSAEMFDHDLNVDLLEALGFNVPPQSEYRIVPDSSMIFIFSDYIKPNIINSSYNHGRLDYYHEENPYEGTFCISWSEAAQYNNIGFDFVPNRDLSYLLAAEYVIDFYIRTTGSSVDLDIRFVDTKTEDPADHPWRMGTSWSTNSILPDSSWHHVQIPIAGLEEKGSWDNGWFEPQGLFDWTAVDRLEIVAEHGDFGDTRLWFDLLRILDPHQSGTAERNPIPYSFNLYQNYPNPFNSASTIQYDLSQVTDVSLIVFDIVGREIVRLSDSRLGPGYYQVIWNGRDRFGCEIPTGIYIARMITPEDTKSIKMVLIK